MEEAQLHDDENERRVAVSSASASRRRSAPSSNRRNPNNNRRNHNNTTSIARRNHNNNRNNYPLYLRCLLIRNLPKGFVGWSDLTDQNTPVRVRRIVYCEESNGSIMVEFMSEAERNTILALDQQRKKRIRQRLQQQLEEGMDAGMNTGMKTDTASQNDEAANNNSSNHNVNNHKHENKSYAFEIKVTVERCSSERFVRAVFTAASHSQTQMPSTLLTGTFSDPATNSAMSSSPSPLSVKNLVKRCIVIRKSQNPNNVEKDLEIPEAPPYQRFIRSDESSSGIRSEQKAQQQRSSTPIHRPPSPMEIRCGNFSEVVVRAATLKSSKKSTRQQMMPAMLVELESEECVERILMAEQKQQQRSMVMENNIAPQETTTTLAIPVEIHPVKSERYANICFGNSSTNTTSTYRTNNERKTRNSIGNGIHSVDDESQITMEVGEKADIIQNGQLQMNGNNHGRNQVTEQIQMQQIKNLQKEIRDIRSEMGRWRARAMTVTTNSNSISSSSSSNNTQENIKIVQESEVAGIKHEPQSNDDENPQNPSSASCCPDKIQSGASLPEIEQLNHQQQEWFEECRKTQGLEQQIKELLVENDRLKKEAEIAESQSPSLEDNTEKSAPEASESSSLKARVDELEQLESELEEAREHQKLAEEARNKLEEENSGLLRYVLELEGHRSGQAMADQERHKELEKKHSDLSTLYRFVQAQAEQSAKELRKVTEEKERIKAELKGFKMAWKNRVEAQRRLEETQNKNNENNICADCEVVEFYSILEDYESTTTSTRSNCAGIQCNNNAEAKPRQTNPTRTVPFENGRSVVCETIELAGTATTTTSTSSSSTKAPISTNGVSALHVQETMVEL